MGGSKEAAVLLQEVVADSTEQAKAIQEMAQGIEQIAGVTQQNSASAEESAATSEEMSAQAVMLKGIVSSFKLQSPDRNRADTHVVGHEKDGVS